MESRRFSVSGSTLKWIAIITMLIDHIGATIVYMLLVRQTPESKGFLQLYIIYWAMRSIGRIAFPIFCYLLVEGIRHTSNAPAYAIRLLIFAGISEIPFDLAFHAGDFSWGRGKNVFFTLFLGFMAVELMLLLNRHCTYMVLKGIGMLGIAALFVYLAEWMQTDYSGVGVLTIILMYFVSARQPHSRRGFAFLISLIPLMLMSTTELPALVDIPLIILYNGKRGRQMKYLFYLFYPVHILILGLILYFNFPNYKAYF